MSQMLMAILVAYSNSGVASSKNFVATSKWRPFWKCENIINTVSIWHQKWKDRPRSCKKNIFIMMTSSMMSQNDLKVISLFSFMNEKIAFSMITKERTNKAIIFKLSVHMYHWIMNMPLQTIVDCFIDDVIGSQNKWKPWTAISLSIFESEHRSKAQNVTNA